MCASQDTAFYIEAKEIDDSVSVIGQIEHLEMAHAAFEAAVKRQPRGIFTMRQGSRIIRRHPDESTKMTFIDEMIRDGKFWP